MKAQALRSLQPRHVFSRCLGISLLLLLAAAAASAQLEIDLTSDACINDEEMPPAPDIEGVVGQSLDPLGNDVIEINAVTPADNVRWTWLNLPGPGCATSDAGRTYVCDNGLTILLPADVGVFVDSGLPVEISGTVATGEEISFELQAYDGTTPCSRRYEVILVAPYDLVLVLDRSGSMRRRVDPDDPIDPDKSRWQELQDAVSPFMDFVAGSSCKEASRFGLTLFASRVLTPGDADPNYQLSDADFTALIDIDPATLAGKVDDELTFQSMPPRPRGSTAMGSGLQDGIAKLDDDTRPRVVMLFTDGEQNRNPRVHLLGTHYDDENDDIPDGEIDPDVKIVSVGIGQPSGTYHDTLSNLATEHGGNYHVTNTDGTDIETTLDGAIKELLDGCSPQMVTSYEGDFSGESPTFPVFAINRKVSQLLVKLSFDRDFVVPEVDYLLKELSITRNGDPVTHYFRLAGGGVGHSYILLQADFDRPNAMGSIPPEGDYSIRLYDKYRVVVFADDKRLGMDWKVEPAARRVDQPFHPTMTLSWLGRPINPDPDAVESSVQAFILEPGDDLGDLLARNDLTVEVSGEEDAGSPGYQKFLALLDSGDLQQVLPKEQQLALEHQGDGVYSAAYNPGEAGEYPGEISGVYQVLYSVKVEGEAFGTVERVARQSVYVRFGDVDLEASQVQTVVNGQTVAIDFRPITTYGRYIGPAQGDAFSIAGEGITLSNISDNQDGSYSLTLEGDPDAEISLNLLGEEIYQGEAAKCCQSPDQPPWWQALLDWLLSRPLLLLLLLLLVIIWLIWRRRSSP